MGVEICRWGTSRRLSLQCTTDKRVASMPRRYQGRLDRYDDTGGTGYHVIYDDGDEEALGDTIEGRDDVRLLLPEGGTHSSSASEVNQLQ